MAFDDKKVRLVATPTTSSWIIEQFLKLDSFKKRIKVSKRVQSNFHKCDNSFMERFIFTYI